MKKIIMFLAALSMISGLNAGLLDNDIELELLPAAQKTTIYIEQTITEAMPELKQSAEQQTKNFEDQYGEKFSYFERKKWVNNKLIGAIQKSYERQLDTAISKTESASLKKMYKEQKKGSKAWAEDFLKRYNKKH